MGAALSETEVLRAIVQRARGIAFWQAERVAEFHLRSLKFIDSSTYEEVSNRYEIVEATHEQENNIRRGSSQRLLEFLGLAIDKINLVTRGHPETTRFSRGRG